ncbi:hypothetical protein D0Y65_021762 [Glycine soja]|uniref:Uncharacterized protein n=1 Tax=Glycine soja TaxID=3848 RepID=A0A445JKM1_GLYSO|nr:hypothetical protein D0Y65_021762 [Glycine soja]
MTKSKGKDPLEGLGGPMTRARARKAKEALQQVMSILFEYKPKFQGEKSKVSNPDIDHWRAAKKVMRYLQETKDYMLMYRQTKKLDVIGYSDSDFASCVDSRKSTSGVRVRAWKNQNIEALSWQWLEVVGRALPTEADQHPKIYRMMFWATNKVHPKFNIGLRNSILLLPTSFCL